MYGCLTAGWLSAQLRDLRLSCTMVCCLQTRMPRLLSNLTAPSPLLRLPLLPDYCRWSGIPAGHAGAASGVTRLAAAGTAKSQQTCLTTASCTSCWRVGGTGLLVGACQDQNNGASVCASLASHSGPMPGRLLRLLAEQQARVTGPSMAVVLC